MSSQFPESFDSIKKLIYDCTQTRSLKSLKSIHTHLLKSGLLYISSNILSELVNAYSSTCLHTTKLKTLTKFLKCIIPTSPLPFNVVISEFSRNRLPLFALKTLSFMHGNSVALDSYSICSCLTASATLCDVKFGKLVHAHVVKSGWMSSVFVSSALIDLYAKSLIVGDAAKVFDEIPVKNTVCANALLAGYGEAKLWIEGIELVRMMPALSLEYDHFTLAAVLRACAGLSAIELGRQVHGYLVRKMCDIANDVFLLSSLIEMYGKCGLVGKALQVFSLEGTEQKVRKRDIVLWTSMLGAYGRNGHFQEVIGLYKEMLRQDIRPDGVAFVTIISACSRTGLVELGVDLFKSMTRDYNIDPAPEHYSCLVDLLCRAGELDRAWKLINEMINKGHGNGSISMWGALLNACMDRGNIDMGKMAAQKALEVEHENVGIYVMLSNLYAKFGMWYEIQQLRVLMREIGLRKDVGSSWIEITG